MRNIVLSAGGHAAVVAAVLRDRGAHVAGFTDPRARRGSAVEGAEVLGGDSVLDRVRPGAVRLYNGLGAAKDTGARRRLYESFAGRGFRFPPVAARSAWVARTARLEAGAQVLTRAVVHEGALVGALAVVLPGIRIGAGARVGAGATVTRDVPAGATVVGTPARRKR